MKLNYYFHPTPNLKNLEQRLLVLSEALKLLPHLPMFTVNWQRQSLLKSSLFSARIEGNNLQPQNLTEVFSSPKTKAKQEIINLYRAMRWLYSTKCPKQLSPTLILKLHRLTMQTLISPAGSWRREMGAIFNQAGVAVYLSPPPDEIIRLVADLIKQTNRSSASGFVKAAQFHFIFEKIHPFLDGNGRVGRLLSNFLLKQSGLDFNGALIFEEYLENNRQNYYDLLADNSKDITPFVEFFTRGLVNQAEKIIHAAETAAINPEDNLLPRRQEILAIIKDHQTITFDFLKRRFLAIPERTLHYDLQQLLKKGFIRKLGSTRGAVYLPASSAAAAEAAA